jgi:hypothetical protein
MKTINVKEKEGKSTLQLSQEVATENDFNRYSKPPASVCYDYETETEEFFHFAWKGKLLQVVIEKLVPGYKYGPPPEPADMINDKPVEFTANSTLLTSI